MNTEKLKHVAKNVAHKGYAGAKAGAKFVARKSVTAYKNATPQTIALVGGGVVVSALVIMLIRRVKPLDPSVKEALLTKMNSFIGTPYIWGGKNPREGLDCSGAVTAAVVAAGLAPPSFKNNNAESLYKISKKISSSDVEAGDVAFYGSTMPWGKVSHILMTVGDGRVMGASGGGPSTTSVAIAKQQGAEVKILPKAEYRSDFVGYGRLPLPMAVSV